MGRSGESAMMDPRYAPGCTTGNMKVSFFLRYALGCHGTGFSGQ